MTLELGSGVSTLLGAKLCEQFGRGRILSVDHDSEWAKQTIANLRRYGLEHRAQVIVAPLQKLDIEGEPRSWYGVGKIMEVLDSPIDLLVVDGPPSPSEEPLSARYPALPLLEEKLSPDATIFIDDAGRVGEREMVNRWLEQYPGWHRRDYDVGDGVIVLTHRG